MTIKSRVILQVEDREEDRASLEDAVAAWNDAHGDEGRKFEIWAAFDATSALLGVEARRIDCALLDLRLPEAENDKPDIATGNALAQRLLGSRGMPLAVISGHPADVDAQTSLNGLISIFNKGDADSFSKAVDWLGSQWNMMEVLAIARSKMEQVASEVFVKRIWPQWSSLVNAAGPELARQATIVSRQYLSHAAELLGLGVPDNEAWHPLESYIVPPLRDHRAHTGDIFDIDGGLWIVLTPQCDMAEGNGSPVLLARCEVNNEKYNSKLASFRQNRQNVDSAKRVRDFVNQNISAANHFLPPLPGTDIPLIVNFRELKIVDREGLAIMLASRKASVSMPFLPNLIQRFGAFLTRSGQPNIDVQHF